jgi:RHS repeat-associated protein
MAWIAECLQAAANRLEELIPNLDWVRAATQAVLVGEFAAAAGLHFDMWFNGPYAVAKLVEALRGLRGLAANLSGLIREAKLRAISTLVITEETIRWAVASADFTDGLSLAEIAIALRTAMLAIDRLMMEVAEHIVEALASTLTTTAVPRLALEGALFGAGQEAGVQALGDVLDGHPVNFNVSQVIGAALSMAAAGLVLAPAKALTERMGAEALTDGVSKGGGHGTPEALADRRPPPPPSEVGGSVTARDAAISPTEIEFAAHANEPPAPTGVNESGVNGSRGAPIPAAASLDEPPARTGTDPGGVQGKGVESITAPETSDPHVGGVVLDTSRASGGDVVSRAGRVDAPGRLVEGASDELAEPRQGVLPEGPEGVGGGSGPRAADVRATTSDGHDLNLHLGQDERGGVGAGAKSPVVAAGHGSNSDPLKQDVQPVDRQLVGGQSATGGPVDRATVAGGAPRDADSAVAAAAPKPVDSVAEVKPGGEAHTAVGDHSTAMTDPQLPENGHDPALRDQGVDQDALHPARSTEPGDQCLAGEPVDMATGEYFLPMVDVQLPGVLPLVLTRQHRSQYRRGVWFGPSWTSSFDARAVVSEDGVTTIDADGTMLFFEHPQPGEPRPARHGRNWLLFSSDSGGYRLESQDSERSFLFDPKPGLNGTDRAVGNLSISAITDRHQNRIVFEYRANGIPVAVSHSGGYRIVVHSNGHRITGYDLADPDGGPDVPLRRFGFQAGNLATVTDSCGATTSFAYDGAHQMVGWVDSTGARYENVYDHHGRVCSQQGTSGVWSGTFDFVSTVDGQVTTYTDAYGAQTVYEFDDDLRPRRVMDPQGRVTVTDFNRWRDPLAVTDPSGATTRYGYTDHGDIAQITDALGAVTQFGYAGPNRPNSIERQGSSPILLSYDQAGNVVSVTSGEASRCYEYNSAGALTATVDEEGRRTQIKVNAAGLPTCVTDADGHASAVEYDAFGRPSVITDPHGHRTTLIRDVEGRVRQRIAADGSTQTWEYDGEGNCVAHIDEVGAVTRFEYGFYDKVTAQIAADGSRTEYRYDQARRLIEVVNPQELTWRYTYYRDGQLRSETDFNGATTSYHYDITGRLAERINAEGQSIRYRYDPLGRPITETTSAAAGSDNSYSGEVTRYTYGPGGDLIEAINAHGTGTYSHDQLSRTSTATWNAHTVTASVNAAGQLTGVISPSGMRTDYTYDHRGVLDTLVTAGRLIDLTIDAAGWITHTHIGATSAQRHFDPVGRLVTQTWTASSEGQLSLTTPAGPVGAHRTLTDTTYAYRPDGALTTRTRHRESASGTTAVRTDYTLDTLGRITTTTIDGTMAEHYGYDPTNNITTATTAATTPAAVATESCGGDEHSATCRYSGTLLLDDGRSRYTYDKCGRLTHTVTKRLGRKPDVWRYQWDAHDRLRAVTTPNGHTWTYGYDTANRRTHKTNTTTGHTTTFTWLGNQLLEQTTHHDTYAPDTYRPASGEHSDAQTSDAQTVAPETTTWTYLPGAPTPLAQIHTTTDQLRCDTMIDVPLQIGGTTRATTSAHSDQPPQRWTQPDVDRAFYAIVTDHLGTPTHLINPATAQITAQATTTLWGHTTWTGDATSPIRFPGQYHDPETGWHYNHHRYYQPTTGRYTAPDPLGLAPAPNPHTYPTNPTTHTDPLGLAPCDARNTPGTATGGENLRPVSEGEQWLRGAKGNAGRIPGQVADALRGREFRNLRDFREQFWIEVSQHPELRSQFSPQNQALMEKGNSPFAASSQSYNGSRVYHLHHMDPIHNDGGVYDLRNIVVVTPRYHAAILDPGFHYDLKMRHIRWKAIVWS